MIRKIFGDNRDGVGNLGHYQKFLGPFRPPIIRGERNEGKYNGQNVKKECWGNH
jgi:hypothetical protein